MKTFVLALTIWFMAVSVQAATLIWDGTNLGPLTIERGTSPTGQFTPIATVPTGTTQYILTPGAWGHYRVSNAVGVSNTVQFGADLYAGPVLDRLDAIETRLTALETDVPPPPPAPASTFTITHIDQNHIRIVCNGIGITTSGSGTSRTMECRQ